MIVVTGGAGFIGSNVAAALEARGKEIVICDRLRDQDKWRNIAKRELVDFVFPEDLGDYLDRHADQVESIVHMGAISATTETDGDRIVRDNLAFSLRIWEWCTSRQTPLIYASSAATYGDGSAGFDDAMAPEALATLHPLNLYGWSKHVFDRRVARLVAAGSKTPPQWVGLKFFNVYGPNEYHKGGMKSVVSQLYPRLAAGEPAKLFRSHNPDYADGGQLRDFVYVKDCVEVICWLLEHPTVSGLFNLGTGQARSFADLATATMRAMQLEPRIEYIPMPEALQGRYQYFTQAEMARLRQAGYQRDFTSLEDGVSDYVQNYLAAADPYC